MINLPDPGPYDPHLELFKLRLALAVVGGALLCFVVAAVVTW